jgi:hypothetical protein
MRCAKSLRSRLTLQVSLPLVCASVLLSASSAHAQVASTSADSEVHEERTRHQNRIYFGMWTVHLKHEVLALHNNWVGGMSYRGFFGATFLNSYGRRAFTGGLQRTFVLADARPIGATVGYRLGFVTGYDGRLMRLARETPVLPLAQPFAAIDIEHVSLEVSYTFVVISVAMSYRF